MLDPDACIGTLYLVLVNRILDRVPDTGNMRVDTGAALLAVDNQAACIRCNTLHISRWTPRTFLDREDVPKAFVALLWRAEERPAFWTSCVDGNRRTENHLSESVDRDLNLVVCGPVDDPTPPPYYLTGWVRTCGHGVRQMSIDVDSTSGSIRAREECRSDSCRVPHAASPTEACGTPRHSTAGRCDAARTCGSHRCRTIHDGEDRGGKLYASRFRSQAVSRSA